MNHETKSTATSIYSNLSHKLGNTGAGLSAYVVNSTIYNMKRYYHERRVKQSDVTKVADAVTNGLENPKDAVAAVAENLTDPTRSEQRKVYDVAADLTGPNDSQAKVITASDQLVNPTEAQNDMVNSSEQLVGPTDDQAQVVEASRAVTGGVDRGTSKSVTDLISATHKQITVTIDPNDFQLDSERETETQREGNEMESSNTRETVEVPLSDPKLPENVNQGDDMAKWEVPSDDQLNVIDALDGLLSEEKAIEAQVTTDERDTARADDPTRAAAGTPAGREASEPARVTDDGPTNASTNTEQKTTAKTINFDQELSHLVRQNEEGAAFTAAEKDELFSAYADNLSEGSITIDQYNALGAELDKVRSSAYETSSKETEQVAPEAAEVKPDEPTASRSPVVLEPKLPSLPKREAKVESVVSVEKEVAPKPDEKVRPEESELSSDQLLTLSKENDSKEVETPTDAPIADREVATPKAVAAAEVSGAAEAKTVVKDPFPTGQRYEAEKFVVVRNGNKTTIFDRDTKAEVFKFNRFNNGRIRVTKDRITNDPQMMVHFARVAQVLKSERAEEVLADPTGRNQAEKMGPLAPKGSHAVAVATYVVNEESPTKTTDTYEFRKAGDKYSVAHRDENLSQKDRLVATTDRSGNIVGGNQASKDYEFMRGKFITMRTSERAYVARIRAQQAAKSSGAPVQSRRDKVSAADKGGR